MNATEKTFQVGEAVRLLNARHFYGPGLPPLTLEAGDIVEVVGVARKQSGATVYVVEEEGGRRQHAPDYELEAVQL